MSWLVVLGSFIALYYMLKTYIRVESLQMDIKRLTERIGSLSSAVESMRENVRHICSSMGADIGGQRNFEVVTPNKAAELMAHAHILDVRSAHEFELSYLPGAVNIPAEVLQNQLESLPKARALLVYCQKGIRSEKACRMLAMQGFEQVHMLEGGLDAWEGELVRGKN
ncbi:MAG: rhodanese-like domain-containing protein [Planctomycetota bacterium]|nr:rhodanese-like domain-containing protein [Planctomycetota bacterium]MDA1139673.1 rhodanese-like domain-containing protein [Planctomycetota bacterium]